MTTAQIAGLLASSVLPLLVGYLTKASTPAAVKSLLLLLVSAATTTATSVASGAELKASVTTGLLAYATAVASHYGLLKPSGATEAVAGVGVKDAEEEFDPGFPEDLEDVAAEEDESVGSEADEAAIEEDAPAESE